VSSACKAQLKGGEGEGGGDVILFNAFVLMLIQLVCHRSPILREFIYFSKEVTEETKRILPGFKKII